MLRLFVIGVIYGFCLSGAHALTFKSGDTLPSNAAGNSKTYSEDEAVSSLFQYDPQYEKYKSLIATPMRDFKVYDAFTLVDDEEWDQLSTYHDHYITGRWELRGQADWEIRQGIDPTKCLDSAKHFTTEAGGAKYNYEWQAVVAKCTNILYGKFYNEPFKGAADLKEILLYWHENDILKNMNDREATINTNVATNMTYAVMSKVGQMMAHLSLYHRYYDLTEQEYLSIDQMFTEFVTSYNYYNSFKRKGNFTREVCNLSGKGNTVKTTNDHCGSFNLRIATGATLYGLEFGNQTVYDYGIRKLEITLATFDKYHGYSSQMNRGTLALGYARQMVAPIDQLTYAFEKAFDFDFAHMELHRGTTPNKVYVQLLKFAEDPSLFAHYDIVDKRGKALPNYIKQIKKGKSPEIVWDAFNLNDYYVSGGSLARNNFPDTVKYYQIGGLGFMRSSCCADHALQIDSSILVGFNPYILRDATGRW